MSDVSALVAQSSALIERISELRVQRDAAVASLATVRAVLANIERKATGQGEHGACWCELEGRGVWAEEEHEPGCQTARLIFRRLAGALEGGAR